VKELLDEIRNKINKLVFTFRIELEALMTSVDSNRYGSNGGHSSFQLVLITLWNIYITTVYSSGLGTLVAAIVILETQQILVLV
jgi:hypothetical protein